MASQTRGNMDPRHRNEATEAGSGSEKKTSTEQRLHSKNTFHLSQFSQTRNRQSKRASIAGPDKKGSSTEISHKLGSSTWEDSGAMGLFSNKHIRMSLGQQSKDGQRRSTNVKIKGVSKRSQRSTKSLRKGADAKRENRSKAVGSG